jgi:hypothetical protein
VEDVGIGRLNYRPLWQLTTFGVFTTPRGEPFNPNTDHGYWKRLLADAASVTAGSTTPGTPRPRCC